MMTGQFNLVLFFSVHKSWKMIGCAYVYYFARPEKGWLGEFRLVQRSYKYQ